MPHPSAMNGTAMQSGARHRYGKHVGIYEKQSRDRQEALPRTRELAALVLSLPPGRGSATFLKRLHIYVAHPTRFDAAQAYSQRKFGEGDQLFIFFAGHGVFDDVFKQGYIVARDSRKDDDETRGGYESHDNLRTIVNSMRARHILLVMDA